MSKVINFNAREFKFDTTCNDNVGSRMFVTDCIGQNAEIYEIGDWEWAWTQIYCEKQLEKNTDYVFRFAMTGGINNTCDGTSQFMVIPIEGEELTPQDWENRYVFNLLKSQYQPILSKSWSQEMLRVYEVPFNTCDCEKFRFVFVSHHVVTKLFPAQELSAYADFKDYSYNDWYNEQFGNRNNLGGNSSSSIREYVMKTVTNALNGSSQANESFNDGGMNIKRTNEDLSGSDLSHILNSMTDGGHIEIKNCNISDVNEFPDCGPEIDDSYFKMINSNIGGMSFGCLLSKIGDGGHLNLINTSISHLKKLYTGLCYADSCNIELKGVTIAASAFSALMSKLGDGCVLDINNTYINADDFNIDLGSPSDGCNIELKGTTIAACAFSSLLAKLGDGCVLDINNTYIEADNSEINFGAPADGIVINFNNSQIPDSIYHKLFQKTNDGCQINENGLEIYNDDDYFKKANQTQEILAEE